MRLKPGILGSAGSGVRSSEAAEPGVEFQGFGFRVIGFTVHRVSCGLGS